MLTILDKYLIKRLLITYIFAVFIIVLIVCVIDFVEKNDNFIKNQAPMNLVLLDYYANLAPYWANTISPLMVFIAVVFFTAQMASHTEIIAILSAGVSFRRLMLPYLIGASLIAVLTFSLQGWILPKANKTRIAFENKYVHDQFYYADRDVHLAVAPNVYAYLSSYNTDSKTGFDFTLEKIENNQLVEKLHAMQIEWKEKTKKWTMRDYKIRKIRVSKEELFFYKEKDTLLNISPKDFESNYAIYETFTINELNDRINLLRSRGAEGVEAYEIERHQRFVTPFAALILAAIGLIVSARKARGGVGVQIAVGFFLAFAYILFFIMSKGIAEAGSLPTVIAVWLPNIIFSVIGVVLYFTVPR